MPLSGSHCQDRRDGQSTLNEHIDKCFKNKTDLCERYGSDLDLSYLGL